VDVSLVIWEFDEDHFCMLSTYVSGDDAWYYELSEARPTSKPGNEIRPRDGFAPGPAVVTVVSYDAEVEKPADVYFGANPGLPFEVLRHFTELVAQELEGRDAGSVDSGP
jgi:hypothetical protein